MNTLSQSQLEFLRSRITNEDRELYATRARQELTDLTRCYPDLPNRRDNRDHWVFPFGIRVPAEDLSPAQVVNRFVTAVKDRGLTQEDVDLLNDTKSLFEHYNLRRDPDHADRFHCTVQYFQSNFFWLLLWAAGQPVGNDYKATNDWLDLHPNVRGYGWEVDCHGIRVRHFLNGRIDLTLTPEQRQRIDQVFALYKRHRELEGVANADLRAQQDADHAAYVKNLNRNKQ